MNATALSARSIHITARLALIVLATLVGWTGYEYAQTLVSERQYDNCHSCKNMTLHAVNMAETESAVVVTTTSGATIYLPKRDSSVLALKDAWSRGYDQSLKARVLNGTTMYVSNVGGTAVTYQQPDIARNLWTRAFCGTLLLSLLIFAFGSMVRRT